MTKVGAFLENASPDRPQRKKKVQKEDEGQGEPEAKGEEETMDVEVAQPEKWRRKPWSCA